ncbi:unnamed protein product [Parnassius mnemosyne]|uniref:Uncharacterized protein n=1 Tax=Parnassius mnemosyne TaxID=213953 RepID=A0AAV1L3F9_9NEOP
MPWMGVLIYKPDNHSLEEVTNIVMVEQQIAIGNAKDIAAVDEDSLKYRMNFKLLLLRGRAGVSKLRPASKIWPAIVTHLARDSLRLVSLIWPATANVLLSLLLL